MSFNSAAGLLRKPMIAPVSLGATGSGGKTSKIIDRAGYEDVGITFEYGAISATNATVAVNLKDGDTTGALANVTGALILGLTLAAAGIGATSSRVSDVSKNVAKSIQYIGLKRYVEVTMAPTISGGIVASALAVLGRARALPTADVA